MDMNIRDLTGVSSDTVCKHFHISNNSWEGAKRLYQNYDMKDCKVWYFGVLNYDLFAYSEQYGED